MIDVLQTLDRFLGRVAMDESEGQWLHHCDRLVPMGSKEQGSGLNPGAFLLIGHTAGILGVFLHMNA